MTHKFLSTNLIYRSDMIKDNDTRIQISIMQWKNPCTEVLGSTFPTVHNIYFYIFVFFCARVCVHSKRSHFDLIESNCENQVNLTSVIKIIF